MGAIHLPDSLQNFFNVVLGMKWPEGDEDELSAMSDDWLDFQDALVAAGLDYLAQASMIKEAMSGDFADQLYDQYHKQIPDNLKTLADAAGQMSDACLQTAAAIQKAKIMFVFMALMALLIVIELLSTLIGAIFVPAVEAAARIGLMVVARQLVARVASISIREIALKLTTREGLAALGESIGRGVTEGAQATVKVAPGAVKRLGIDVVKYGAIGAGMMGGVDLVADGITDAETNRHGKHWHHGVDGQAVFSSAVLGFVGGGLFGAGRAFSRGIDIVSKDFRANLNHIVTKEMSAVQLKQFTRSTQAFKNLGYTGFQMALGGAGANLIINKLQDPVSELGHKLFPGDGQGPDSPHAPESPVWAGLLSMFSRAQGAKAIKLNLGALKSLHLQGLTLADLKSIGIPDLNSVNVWDLRKLGIEKIDLNDEIAPGATDLTDEQRERNRLDLRELGKGSTKIGNAVTEFLMQDRGETGSLYGKDGGFNEKGSGFDEKGDETGSLHSTDTDSSDSSTLVDDRSSTWSGDTAHTAPDGSRVVLGLRGGGGSDWRDGGSDWGDGGSDWGDGFSETGSLHSANSDSGGHGGGSGDGSGQSSSGVGGSGEGSGGRGGAGADGDGSRYSRPQTVTGKEGGWDAASAGSPFRAAPGDIPVQHSENPLGASFLRPRTSDLGGKAAAQAGHDSSSPDARSGTSTSAGGDGQLILSHFLGDPQAVSGNGDPTAASVRSGSDPNSTFHSDWSSESKPEPEATTPDTGSRPGTPHPVKQATTLVPEPRTATSARTGQGEPASATRPPQGSPDTTPLDSATNGGGRRGGVDGVGQGMRGDGAPDRGDAMSRGGGVVVRSGSGVPTGSGLARFLASPWKPPGGVEAGSVTDARGEAGIGAVPPGTVPPGPPGNARPARESSLSDFLGGRPPTPAVPPHPSERTPLPTESVSPRPDGDGHLPGRTYVIDTEWWEPLRAEPGEGEDAFVITPSASPGARPAMRRGKNSGFRGVVRYDLDQSPSKWNIRLRSNLVPGEGVTADELPKFQERIQEAVRKYLNDPKYRLPGLAGGAKLSVNLDFVDDARAAHVKHIATSQDGKMNEQSLLVDAPLADIAHEVAHALGVRDARQHQRALLHGAKGDPEPGDLMGPHTFTEYHLPEEALAQIVELAAPFLPANPDVAVGVDRSTSVARHGWSVEDDYTDGFDAPPEIDTDLVLEEDRAYIVKVKPYRVYRSSKKKPEDVLVNGFSGDASNMKSIDGHTRTKKDTQYVGTTQDPNYNHNNRPYVYVIDPSTDGIDVAKTLENQGKSYWTPWEKEVLYDRIPASDIIGYWLYQKDKNAVNGISYVGFYRNSNYRGSADAEPS